MNRSKKILAASMAFMFGVSGLVLAGHFVNEHLNNPGFELDNADWTVSGTAARVATGGVINGPAMSINMLDDSSFQSVGIEGCSPYGLATFQLSGFYNNLTVETVGEDEFAIDYASTASMMIEFFDSDDAFMDDVGQDSDTPTIDYLEMMVSGGIPAWAMSATVTVSGMPHDPEHDGHDSELYDDLIAVNWDDMAFATDCVVDYAKVSGKAGQGNRGKDGENGQYSFSGAIGTLESDACGVPVGEIHINYKSEGFSCTYTPESAPAYFDNDEDGIADYAELGVEYECTDDGTNTGVDALIVLTQGAGGSNKNNGKDRGNVSVINAGGAPFDIDDASLRNGNVNLSSGSCEVLEPEPEPDPII